MWTLALGACVIGVTLPGSTADSTGDSGGPPDSGTPPPTTPTTDPSTCGDGARDPGELCLSSSSVLPLYGVVPRRVAVGDWDGGALDVVIAADDALGAFTPGATAATWLAAPPFAGRPTALAFGAFDLEPSMDLAIGTASAPPVIALGDGAGGVRATLATVGSGGTRDVATGELRGGGLLTDLAVGAVVGGGVVQSIDGITSASWPSTLDGAQVALAATSPDHTSVATANGTTLHVVALATDVDGPIAPGIEHTWALPEAALDVAAADTDADGDDDLYVLLQGGALLQLVSDGADGWAPWVELDPMDKGEVRAAAPPVGHPNVSLPPFELEVGDMDGDGALDLLAVAPYQLWWLLNDGAGAFAVRSTSGSSPTFLRVLDVALADVDEDGDPDIVSAQEAGSVAVLWSTP